MTKMINWRLATIRLWVLSIAFLGISLANVSCTSAEDEPSGQIREEGFFTSEVNALIDANYPEVVANGYAELIIPSTMFDPGIMKYADYFMLGLKAPQHGSPRKPQAEFILRQRRTAGRSLPIKQQGSNM